MDELLTAAGGKWSEVELTLQKTLEKTREDKVSGKFVTRIYLENERKWPEWMIENSLQWAKAHGKWRVSPIHGADEWELPLDEEFSNATSVAVQDTPARCMWLETRADR